MAAVAEPFAEPEPEPEPEALAEPEPFAEPEALAFADPEAEPDALAFADPYAYAANNREFFSRDFQSNSSLKKLKIISIHN